MGFLFLSFIGKSDVVAVIQLSKMEVAAVIQLGKVDVVASTTKRVNSVIFVW